MLCKLRYILLLFAVVSLCGCSIHSQVEERVLPVHITIPVEGVATRTIGDPGVTSGVNLPEYAYLFLATYASQADAEAKTNGTCYALEATLFRANWLYNEERSNPSAGIILYDYAGTFSMHVPEGLRVARLYVALSNARLTLPTVNSTTTEQEIIEMTFDIPDTYFEVQGGMLTAKDELNDFLKNLYTTPYNLLYEGLGSPYESFNGQYYGTLLDVNSHVPYLDIVCYHAAAKLDVIWNVEDNSLGTKKVTSVSATGLYKKNCSLFNPTNKDNMAIEGAYRQSFGSIGTGNEWYGRSAIYVIQKPSAEYTFEVGVNGEVKTEAVHVTYVSDSPYTPWMRGFIRVK